jgi:hypothetical protein
MRIRLIDADSLIALSCLAGRGNEQRKSRTGIEDRIQPMRINF